MTHFLTNDIPADDSRWVTAVYVSNGVPVATCDIGNWKTEHPQISNFCVQPEYRRKHIGEAMLKKCIDLCQVSKKTAINLRVHKKNEAAIALYRKAGFKSCIEDDNFYWMALTL